MQTLQTKPPQTPSRSPLWIFGYGSLIWRPDFPFVEARRGWIDGWARRFYQGSPDHRGTPEYPGRVVTLLPDVHSRTWGVAYRPHPEHTSEILHRLDIREQGGYCRERVSVDVGQGEVLDALVYMATPDNAHYLGPAPVDQMAQRIIDAHGPSGANRDYLFALETQLRQHQIDDPHVFTLAQMVRQLL